MRTSVVHRGVVLLALLAVTAIAGAQTSWPERPIQLIVPFPAGGSVDVLARPFAEIFGELVHQSVVVMVRDGASGTIGVAAVAAARPDGYTLAFTPNGPLTVQPHVIATLPYKQDSLVPLCQVFAVQYALVVRADSPYKTLADLIATAKAQPGKLSYGIGGIATAPHLAIAQLALAADFHMLSVPFRGDPPAILALKAGDIDSAMLNVGGAKAQGFRALAVFADARAAEYPDTPTVKQAGYPVVSSAFGGVFAPKGLPAEIAAKIDSACEKVVRDERFQRTARQTSQDAVYRNRNDFARMLADDYAIKADVVKRAGIKPP